MVSCADDNTLKSRVIVEVQSKLLGAATWIEAKFSRKTHAADSSGLVPRTHVNTGLEKSTAQHDRIKHNRRPNMQDSNKSQIIEL